MSSKLISRKGFTLIEMVMVLVIIGLLSAIIIPKFVGHRDSAAIASTKANLESLRTAIGLYYAEEGEWPPVVADTMATLKLSPNNNSYIRDIPCEAISDNGNECSIYLKASCNDQGGWCWDDTVNELYLNLTGTDAKGQDYDTY